MHKTILALLFCIFFSHVNAQSDDKALNTRLAEYMKWSGDLNFEKLMDYIHPRLFQIAPKELLLQALKAPFESEDVKVSLDSLAIVEVSAAFAHQGTTYRKVTYSMAMDMRFTDEEALQDDSFINLVLQGLRGEFPQSTVSYQTEKKNFHISGRDMLIAIKDADKPWMFIGVEKEGDMMEKLFAEPVRKKFGF